MVDHSGSGWGPVYDEGEFLIMTILCDERGRSSQGLMSLRDLALRAAMPLAGLADDLRSLVKDSAIHVYPPKGVLVTAESVVSCPEAEVRVVEERAQQFAVSRGRRFVTV
jgi:hypothetical protein